MRRKKVRFVSYSNGLAADKRNRSYHVLCENEWIGRFIYLGYPKVRDDWYWDQDERIQVFSKFPFVASSYRKNPEDFSINPVRRWILDIDIRPVLGMEHHSHLMFPFQEGKALIRYLLVNDIRISASNSPEEIRDLAVHARRIAHYRKRPSP